MLPPLVARAVNSHQNPRWRIGDDEKPPMPVKQSRETTRTGHGNVIEHFHPAAARKRRRNFWGGPLPSLQRLPSHVVLRGTGGTEREPRGE